MLIQLSFVTFYFQVIHVATFIYYHQSTRNHVKLVNAARVQSSFEA